MMVFLLSGCLAQGAVSDKVAAYEDNIEITGEEKEEMLEGVSETVTQISDRSNVEAEEVVIGAVSDGGEEVRVTPGRYQITGNVTGNVVIRDEAGDVLIEEILGSYYGVESITADLTESHVIEVDGLDQVSVVPVATEMSTELGAGIWQVGTDIAPGSYSITSPNGFGYLQVFQPNEDVHVYEVIGGEFAATESTVELTEGQTLRIKRISLISFQPAEG
ncbi:hypothetical protein [Lentibacillus sediminis]|uniref:hypothetical protein n=1 Tax=Lentibacillus sediminis TaxID=1940529 RepID=UPI00117A70D7|nr:hypothetical protein [Lentibacillus sediminis]